MTATNPIKDHWHLQFTKNVELMLQQRNSRFLEGVTQASYTGDKAQVLLQYGSVEMSELAESSWQSDTSWADMEHYQRWVLPTDYSISLPVTKQDQLRTLVDPRSSYAEAVRAAYARKVDDVIIAAALGKAKTGKYSSMSDTVLPSAQKITTSGGLTIAKLLKAKEMLMAAGCDPSEPRFLACTEQQLSDLLATAEVKSADYNTVRALVRGEVDTFVGFKFISSERLAKSTGTGTPRMCIAWVKSGLHLGIWQGLEVKIDTRPDKNYVWQIYARATLGATRTNENKVVEIDCTEASA